MEKVVFLMVAVIPLTICLAQDCFFGRDCNQDAECKCSDERVVCNYKLICQRYNFIDEMMRKKPCFRIYKKTCETDVDCPCKGGQLICENGECVSNRNLVARSF